MANVFNQLREFGSPMTAPPNSVIIQMNDHSQGVYLVTSGTVRISLHNDEGILLWSRIAGEGELLGLPSAIANEPQGVKAVALEPTELIFIDREKLMTIIRDKPAFLAEVVELLSTDYLELQRRWSSIVRGKQRGSHRRPEA